ncbi:Myb DNA-bind 5 domain-containing protein [Aphis craccivora]|uniref:Regulatory protein zeste n=1 Tax=Aphis craccivora TaxID=307492 RepID=A0A6G0WJ28_APHCR|nr:Myb DNA-bind 5 domain-containing protein [Aphis craccivora]
MAKSRPTKHQMKTLVELISNDPKLSAGKFSANFTKKIAKARWEDIGIELNSLPGCEKSWDKWKKAWQDTRATAKNKASAIKRHINGTGGGPATNLVMSEAQMDSIPLMSQVAISGHLNSVESAVSFNYETLSEQTTCMNIYNKDAETIEDPQFEDLQLDINHFDVVIENNQNYVSNDVDDLSPKLVETGQELQLKSVPKSKGINSEQPMKKQSASERLSDGNKVAQNMVDLTSKKLDIKSNYYNQKLILLQQKNNILSNIHTLLEKYIQNKM